MDGELALCETKEVQPGKPFKELALKNMVIIKVVDGSFYIGGRCEFFQKIEPFPFYFHLYRPADRFVSWPDGNIKLDVGDDSFYRHCSDCFDLRFQYQMFPLRVSLFPICDATLVVSGALA